MKKLYFMITFIFTILVVMGQDKINIEVPFTDMAPSIDGVEDLPWNHFQKVFI